MLQQRLRGMRLSWLWVAILSVGMALAGCAVQPAPAAQTSTTSPTATAAAEEAVGGAVALGSDTMETTAAPPVSLQIAEVGMDVAITPMSWRVVEIDGMRTTAWTLPQAGAGWHPNSAGAGGAGNVVISGHQLLGDAAFAPIALGDVVPGQEIVVTDTNGDSFTYEVTEVTEPLPIPETLAEEEAMSAAYTSPTTVPSLTLISGWPDFSTTHRVIVRAELVSDAQ